MPSLVEDKWSYKKAFEILPLFIIEKCSVVAGYIISGFYTFRGQARHSNFDAFDTDLITTNVPSDKTV